MSRIDDPVDPSVLIVYASRTVEVHRDGGICHECTPAGCPAIEYAAPRLERWRRDRAEQRARASTC